MQTPWPYASVTSADWLTPPGDDDPYLRAGREAVRSLLPATGGGPSQEHLQAALAAAQEVRERLDWVLLSLVGEARASGLSWSDVGAALGVRKQAAHQRFGPYVAQALARAGAEGPEDTP